MNPNRAVRRAVRSVARSSRPGLRRLGRGAGRVFGVRTG